MKTSTILLLGGAAALGYYFARHRSVQATQAAVQSAATQRLAEPEAVEVVEYAVPGWGWGPPVWGWGGGGRRHHHGGHHHHGHHGGGGGHRGRR